MALGYIKCPQCKEISPLYTPYPKCWYCEYEQRIEPNKLENEYRGKVEEMTKYLLPVGTPSLTCPEVSISPRGNDCYGWSNGDTNVVSISRNFLYVARGISWHYSSRMCSCSSWSLRRIKKKILVMNLMLYDTKPTKNFKVK